MAEKPDPIEEANEILADSKKRREQVQSQIAMIATRIDEVITENRDLVIENRKLRKGCL